MSKDHEKIKKYLKIAQGQIEGIIKMIDEDKYCLDINDQIMATRALLKKTGNLILKNHIDNCVKEAIKSGNEEKIDEVLSALERQI